MRKTKKIFREEHIAILDVSSDEQENTPSRADKKKNEKRKLLERRGYLPIIESDSLFEVHSVVAQQAPRASAQQQRMHGSSIFGAV